MHAWADAEAQRHRRGRQQGRRRQQGRSECVATPPARPPARSACLHASPAPLAPATQLPPPRTCCAGVVGKQGIVLLHIWNELQQVVRHATLWRCVRGQRLPSVVLAGRLAASRTCRRAALLLPAALPAARKRGAGDSGKQAAAASGGGGGEAATRALCPFGMHSTDASIEDDQQRGASQRRSPRGRSARHGGQPLSAMLACMCYAAATAAFPRGLERAWWWLGAAWFTASRLTRLAPLKPRSMVVVVEAPPAGRPEPRPQPFCREAVASTPSSRLQSLKHS